MVRDKAKQTLRLRPGKASAALITALVFLAALAATVTITLQRQGPAITTQTYSNTSSTTQLITGGSGEEGDAPFVKSIEGYEELRRVISSSTWVYLYGGGPAYTFGVRTGAGVPLVSTRPVVTPAVTITVTPTTTATSAPEYSQTNVQVAGVDEADIVKTDGKYIYVVGRTTLVKEGIEGSKEVRTQGTPIYIVYAYPPSNMGITAKIEVRGWVSGIFINKDRLVVINSSIARYTLIRYASATTAATTSMQTSAQPFVKPGQNTTILVFNVGNHSKPELERKVSVSGWVLAARMIGNTVYVVTRLPSYVVRPSTEGSIKTSIVLPTINGKAVSPDEIRYVDIPDVLPYSNEYVIVSGLDLSNGAFKAKTYLMPHPIRVYVSKESIYLLSPEWGFYRVTLDIIRDAVLPNLPEGVADEVNATLNNESLPPYSRLIKVGKVLDNYLRNATKEDVAKLLASVYDYLEKSVVGKPLTVTHVFRFKLRGLTATLTAHAEVGGRVLDQFAMDEREGYFRVATTATVIKEFRVASGSPSVMVPSLEPVLESVNNVYVLNASNLKMVGKLEGLEPGERVYAARYVGKYLYLVTFRRIDPLFAIDLSNPREPRVIGFVKMPGYSEYLHPYKDRYLIGVGLDADSSGRVRGLKISLYDVSNPRNISEVSSIKIEGGWSTSQVLWDHKAFLINPSRGYICVPVRIYGEGKVSSYLYVIKVSEDGELSIAGKIEHPNVTRSLYIGNYLYTVSQTLIQSVDLGTMKVVSSVALG